MRFIFDHDEFSVCVTKRFDTIFRYVSVMVELTRIEGTRHGKLIASQMLDVAIRVQAVRPFIVGQMVCVVYCPFLLNRLPFFYHSFSDCMFFCLLFIVT